MVWWLWSSGLFCRVVRFEIYRRFGLICFLRLMSPDCTAFHSREGKFVFSGMKIWYAYCLIAELTAVCFIDLLINWIKTGMAVCSLGGTNRGFKCSIVIPNFSQIFLCSGFPYAVGLPFSSTTSASGTVLFNVFVCRTIITHKTYLFHWVVKIVVMVCTLRILVFRNVLLVSGDWKSLHSTRWPSAYQRLKSTALEDVRLSRLAEVSLTFESALRSNRFEYCSFWRRRGAAVLQNTWYRLLSSQLEQGTFKILKSVLAGPQSVARFKIFLNVTLRELRLVRCSFQLTSCLLDAVSSMPDGNLKARITPSLS